jgi:hypothetical protein
MWERMLDRIVLYRAGDIDLRQLVSDLRGLVIEADPHDPAVRDSFEAQWVRLDGEQELQTEPWAPAGAASEADLTRYLDGLQDWVRSLLAAESNTDHA